MKNIVRLVTPLQDTGWIDFEVAFPPPAGITPGDFLIYEHAHPDGQTGKTLSLRLKYSHREFYLKERTPCKKGPEENALVYIFEIYYLEKPITSKILRYLTDENQGIITNLASRLKVTWNIAIS